MDRNNTSTPSPIFKELLGDFVASLKKDKIFWEFITHYQQLTPFLYDEKNVKISSGYREWGLRAYHNIRIPIEPDIVYETTVPSQTKFCETFLAKLDILSKIIKRKDWGFADLTKYYGSFIRFYCEKNGIKLYLNPMIFRLWFGAFFATIGYLLTIIFLWIFISPYVAVICATFTTAVALAGYFSCIDFF